MWTQINGSRHVELSRMIVDSKYIKKAWARRKKKLNSFWTNLGLIIWQMSLLEITMCERDEPPNNCEKHPRANEAESKC